MASKTLLLLVITNFIIAYSEDIVSDEVKTVKESEETLEDTTLAIEEEDFRTTTEYTITEEDFKNPEADSLETATDETNVDITASLNNVVDDADRNGHSNSSNNIDTVTKVNVNIDYVI